MARWPWKRLGAQLHKSKKTMRIARGVIKKKACQADFKTLLNESWWLIETLTNHRAHELTSGRVWTQDFKFQTRLTFLWTSDKSFHDRRLGAGEHRTSLRTCTCLKHGEPVRSSLPIRWAQGGPHRPRQDVTTCASDAPPTKQSTWDESHSCSFVAIQTKNASERYNQTRNKHWSKG